jgi:hypothetical protein
MVGVDKSIKLLSKAMAKLLLTMNIWNGVMHVLKLGNNHREEVNLKDNIINSNQGKFWLVIFWLILYITKITKLYGFYKKSYISKAPKQVVYDFIMGLWSHLSQLDCHLFRMDFRKLGCNCPGD